MRMLKPIPLAIIGSIWRSQGACLRTGIIVEDNGARKTSSIAVSPEMKSRLQSPAGHPTTPYLTIMTTISLQRPCMPAAMR
jgi:hypothetical protein